MKYTNTGLKTFIIPVLVCLPLFFTNSCGSSKVAKTYDTVEESEKALAKKRKKEGKAARKEAEAVNKRHWDNQTKAAKQSVKKNKKRMKKNKKKGYFVP